MLMPQGSGSPVRRRHQRHPAGPPPWGRRPAGDCPWDASSGSLDESWAPRPNLHRATSEPSPERVVILDGAGHNLQLADLTADDFGGPELEGCNECWWSLGRRSSTGSTGPSTRSGVDASRPTPSAPSPGVGRVRTGPSRPRANLAAATIAAVPPTTSPPLTGPGGWPGASARAPSSHPRADPVRRPPRCLPGAGLGPHRGRRRPHPHRARCSTCLQAKAAINGARRAMRSAGRALPIQTQVTIELTGPCSRDGDRRRSVCLQAMDVDLIGLNCATGRPRCSSPSAISPAGHHPVSCLPNAGLSLGGGRGDALRPDARAAGRVPPAVSWASSACRSSAAAAGPLRPIWPRWWRLRRAHPAARRPNPSRRRVDLTPGPLRAGHVVPGGRRADQCQRVEEIPRGHARGRWDTCVAMARDQVRRGPTSSTSGVDYTGADGWPTWRRWRPDSPPSRPLP